MTAAQYRKVLKDLGITQARAADYLCVTIRTAHGYANGKRIPGWIAKLLRFAVIAKVTPAELKTNLLAGILD